MALRQLSFTFRQFCVWLALLGAAPLTTTAAVQQPPELKSASQDQKAKYIQEESRRSLRDKLEAGRQRYEQRQAFRRLLISGMNVHAETRHQDLPVETSTPTTGTGANDLSPSPLGLQVTLAGIALLALALLWTAFRRWFRLRRNYG